MTAAEHPGFCLTFQPAPDLTLTFAGETPLTVGPNVEAFVRAAPKYAELLEHARGAFQLGDLGATVIHTTNK